MALATFGAGCFWGVEARFREIDGVIDTMVGFMGGKTDRPSYKQVCYEQTGHAEVVHIDYDPTRVSFQQLLDIFWDMHDPTQLNRQGPDIGDQYRSVIFYHDESQRDDAEDSKTRLASAGRFSRPVVTQIVPAGPFYKAEEYHQRYLEKRGLASCHI